MKTTAYYCAVLLLLSVAVKLVTSSSVFHKPKYQALPVGSITPQGWLHKQLDIQAEGLSGILADYWPAIRDSFWVGGSFNDGGLHERAPYWLNGVVPLYFLLNNADAMQMDKERMYRRKSNANSLRSQGFVKTRSVKRQVERYIEFILSNQTKDGWLGPSPTNRANGVFYWGPTMALLALEQYAERKRYGDES